jgi:hypothetical protein
VRVKFCLVCSGLSVASGSLALRLRSRLCGDPHDQRSGARCLSGTRRSAPEQKGTDNSVSSSFPGRDSDPGPRNSHLKSGSRSFVPKTGKAKIVSIKGEQNKRNRVEFCLSARLGLNAAAPAPLSVGFSPLTLLHIFREIGFDRVSEEFFFLKANGWHHLFGEGDEISGLIVWRDDFQKVICAKILH